jgi:hypothetical protein
MPQGGEFIRTIRGGSLKDRISIDRFVKIGRKVAMHWDRPREEALAKAV